MSVLKVYLSWANSILREVNKTIDGIPDIQEGKVLCDLINIVSPNCGIFKELKGLQNVDAYTYIQNALDHMKKSGIKVNFDIQDIIDGDIKAILDCLWQIILNYQVHDIEDNIFKRTVGIGKRNLLEWCQKHLNATFDYRNSLTNNLCADNWLVKLLEKFVSASKSEDRAVYVNNLLRSVDNKYAIPCEIINGNDIVDGTVDEHALVIYIALLKRKTDGNKVTADIKIEKYRVEKPKETISTILRESPVLQREIPTSNMSETQPTVRETISEHIGEYMNDEKNDVVDGTASTYLKEEDKPIILRRPKDYYHQWENNIDRLSQGPVSSPNLTDISSAPEDLVLNIDDFNDSFDKSRPQSESLYKPDISEGHQVTMSETHRSVSRSPTRTVDRFQNSSRSEYRHSPELRHSPHSSTESGRQSRSSVRYHGRRDDRSPSPEAYSHYDDLKHARKEVDDNMPKDLLGNRPSDYRVISDLDYDESKPKRSRSDEREYIKTDDQVSERTKALRKRASASLERESRLRRLNKEKQQYNYNVTQDMIRRNVATDSIAYKPDPANVLTPLRHIGSAERVYKDEDSTFIKQLNVQRNPPRPYQMGIGHVPRREAWETYKSYYDEPSYDDTGYGNSNFLGSLDREINDIDLNISSLERSRRLPRFASTGRINDKLWSQEFRDISSIRNPYRSDFNIYDDDKHMTCESRSRSLSPSRSRIFEIERPRTSLGICEPSYSSTFRYEDVGLSQGKYPDVPLGRFDVRTEYYNPDHDLDTEIIGTEIIQRPRSVSPTPQGINLGYSGPVRRVHEEIWGTDLAEIHGLDPQRQEKWKRLINRTEMTNEDVIELKQALASAIVENDILFAKITNAKKEFSEKLLKTNEVLDDCRKHLATAQAENQELRTFLNQEKRINTALEARIKELEEQLSESVSRNNLIDEELQETVKMLEEARRDTAEMENYISENEKLKLKMSSLERDNSSMKQDMDRMQDTHERSQATNQELRKTLEEVRKERHDLYDELSRLKFRSQYGPTADTSTYADRSSNMEVTRSRSTSPHQVRTFRPILATPGVANPPPPYRSSSTSPSRELTSQVREGNTTTHRISSPPRSARAYSPSRATRAYSPSRATRAYSPSRATRAYSPPRATISHSPSRADPSSVPVPIEHVARLSPISSRNRTTTSYTDRRETSPIRPRSSSLGRTSGYTNYKPTTPSNSGNLYSGRSTSPYRYSTSTTVPSTSHREIYPHRKTRFQSSDQFSSTDYKARSSSAAGFTDYPDLQRFPTRLKYSDYSSLRPSNTYSAGFDDIKEPRVDDSDFETRREFESKSDFDGDEEYEYKYVKKTTTISDHKSDYSSDSPSYERMSRRDTSSYQSPTRSRSQSPRFTASYDNSFRRDTDTVCDRSESTRARSISPARFPNRGILKNARSEQNLNYTPRTPSPVRTTYNTSTRYTSPSRYAPSSSSSTNRVFITPTSSSSTDVVTTTAWDSSNSVSRTVTPNTKYQIEIDGDLSVTVNGNLNVLNRDNFRRTEPPPLSEEQRSYANQLIDKYTRPSCSLRTVNL